MLTVHGTLRREKRQGTGVNSAMDPWDFALGANFAGVAAGRLAAMIGDGVNPIDHPGDILIVLTGAAPAAQPRGAP